MISTAKIALHNQRLSHLQGDDHTTWAHQGQALDGSAVGSRHREATYEDLYKLTFVRPTASRDARRGFEQG
jgi:hypothetical protein